jgi:hypothetical protein
LFIPGSSARKLVAYFGLGLRHRQYPVEDEFLVTWFQDKNEVGNFIDDPAVEITGFELLLQFFTLDCHDWQPGQ